MIRRITGIGEMRAARRQAGEEGERVALVPTMGALHEGHLSLVRCARGESDLVVVSVFVNPTQFGVGEDLDRYPRDLAGDTEKAAGAGADVVFAPEARKMYPEGFSTWVDVEGLSEGLCGGSRLGHFRGVCTVVTKLFNIVAPQRAYFGEKDAQQLAVLRRMSRDLDLSVEIVPCPTVREPDGLAMSSRNVRLSPGERAQATILYRALTAGREAFLAGQSEAATLRRIVLDTLREATLGRVEYVEIVNGEDLLPVETVVAGCLFAVAVHFGGTRLIDNVYV